MAITLTKPGKSHLTGKNEFEIVPVAVPHAEAEDVIAVNCWAGVIHINNTTAGALIITIKDKQETPVVLFNKSVAANDFLHVDMGGQYFPGGLTWQGSAAGLRGYVKGWF